MGSWVVAEISQFKTDPEAGIVYGMRGAPIKKQVNGYIHIRSKTKTSSASMLAHRLIWERVHGPIPKGMQINHINGIKSDNRIANLELATPSRNSKHAYEIGLRSAKGVLNGRAIGKRRKAEIADLEIGISAGRTTSSKSTGEAA